MSRARNLADLLNSSGDVKTDRLDNVTAAGALMDSEVTNLAQVKAFNSADYSTAAHNHSGVYEPADATILKDADIGFTVEAYDATIVKDADIGVTVEAYDTTILKDADIGSTVQAYDATIVVDADIGSTVQAYDADTTKNDVANTFTEDQTFEAITETKTIKSASFTPNLSNDGTLYSCSGSMTITMPTAESGKSFTVVASTPPSWGGTIKWSGGAAPSGTGICIYTFLSDGTNWYGMEAGSDFA